MIEIRLLNIKISAMNNIMAKMVRAIFLSLWILVKYLYLKKLLKKPPKLIFKN